jgi:hypothetical protein
MTNKFRLLLLSFTPLSLCPFVPAIAAAQQPSTPIAIVSINQKNPPVVTGALEVSSGKAMIGTSGSITADDATAEVNLPRRGKLLVCVSTTVNLTADTSTPAGELPGLMLSLEHGALETSFAAGRNSDVILTPDFRILIGGPGASQVKVRLGDHGDTCVDNPGANGPYVIVTSVFEGGAYRVQPGQRVMFQHGSTREVVDNEKEPCGCPPPPKPDSNDFPLAQSAGLAPLTPATGGSPGEGTEPIVPLVKNGGDTTHATQPKPAEQAAAPAPEQKKPEKKRGFFGSIGHFFKQVFGAE